MKNNVENEMNLENKKMIEELIYINEKELVVNVLIGLLEIYDRSLILKKEFNNNIDIINEIEGKDNTITNLYNNIINQVSNLDLLMESINIDDSIGVEYFKKIRNDIYTLLNCLNEYTIEINYTKDISLEILKTKNEKIVPLLDINWFYEYVYKFLTEDLDDLFFRLREIINVIPFRMTKEKFYDTLRYSMSTSLKSVTKIKTDTIIKKYKEIFNPKLSLIYGQKFDKYFMKSLEYNKLDFKNISIENLSEIIIECETTLSEINEIRAMLLNLGTIVNRLIALNKANKYLDKFYKDFNVDLEKIKKAYSKSNYSKFKKVYNSEIEILKNRGKKLNTEFINLSDSCILNEIDIDDKLNDILIINKKILAYLNDKYIEKENIMLEESLILVDDNYLEQSIENLIDYIERNLKIMDNLQRKIRMKRIITLIDIPFKNPDDFFSFLKNYIENKSDSRNAMIVINEVLKIIEKYKVKGV